MARTTYILVDYENVTPDIPRALVDLNVYLVVLIGQCMKSLKTDLVLSMQALASKAKFIQISGSGNNALDFHIAYYLGHFAFADENGFFCVISKDKGYDPLLRHLKTHKILAQRYPDIESIGAILAVLPGKNEQRIAFVKQKLEQTEPGRPATRDKLVNRINSWFGGNLPEDENERIIKVLVKDKIVEEKDGKLIYHLPKSSS